MQHLRLLNSMPYAWTVTPLSIIVLHPKYIVLQRSQTGYSLSDGLSHVRFRSTQILILSICCGYAAYHATNADQIPGLRGAAPHVSSFSQTMPADSTSGV